MIDKLTPRYLETSKDNRLKSPTELIDALNVTVTGDSDGGAGVIKNVKGTESVVMSLPGGVPAAGLNTCIGSVRDEALGVVYFFIHNSEGNHGVYAYSAKTSTYRLIFMDESLDFQENGFVKADVVRVKRRAEDEEFIIPEDTVAPSPEPDTEGEGSLNPGGSTDDISTPDTPITDTEEEAGVDIEVPIDAEPPALELLIFTGSFCDYPLLADADGNITVETILEAGTVVNQLISNGSLSPIEATHQFPLMTLNSEGFSSVDIGLVLSHLTNGFGESFCENLVEPA